jgi:hypothetical protein
MPDKSWDMNVCSC